MAPRVGSAAPTRARCCSHCCCPPGQGTQQELAHARAVQQPQIAVAGSLGFGGEPAARASRDPCGAAPACNAALPLPRLRYGFHLAPSAPGWQSRQARAHEDFSWPRPQRGSSALPTGRAGKARQGKQRLLRGTSPPLTASTEGPSPPLALLALLGRDTLRPPPSRSAGAAAAAAHPRCLVSLLGDQLCGQRAPRTGGPWGKLVGGRLGPETAWLGRAWSGSLAVGGWRRRRRAAPHGCSACCSAALPPARRAALAKEAQRTWVPLTISRSASVGSQAGWQSRAKPHCRLLGPLSAELGARRAAAARWRWSPADRDVLALLPLRGSRHCLSCH